MVRLVDSQCEELPTSGSLLAKLTHHETSWVVRTLVDVFVVVRVAGDAAPVKVNVSAVRRTLPSQVVPLYRVNDRVPFSAVPPVEVIVAASFGSQFCADEADVVSATSKHSLVPSSAK